ncbi:unnamed protein product [Spodoptera exigua]|nr:unnamed protein product [Spodoptera exigua]
MYGPVRDDVKWDNIDLDNLMYPRGDKRKLSILARAWQQYYECSAQQEDALPAPRLLANVIIMLFQGAVARLPCDLCTEPDSVDRLVWMYSRGSDEINMTTSIEDFSEIESYDRLSMEGKVMTIYNVMPEDEGVYWCRDGDGHGGLVIVEVVDNESYTVVKPTTSRGPHPVAAEAYEGVILFTQWSEWSECSVCDKVGRRHRYGICYVNLDQNLIADYLLDSEKTAARIKLMELDDKLIDLFQGGIPCRSQYLPQTMKALDFIQERPSEIMIAMLIIYNVRCEKNYYIRRKVEELDNRSKEMYGPVRDDVKWDNIDLDNLMYPRGDKRKLSILARAWQQYYECSAQQEDALPAPRLLANVIIMLFQGAVARLPCDLCTEPDSVDRLVWMYSRGSDEINMTTSIEDFSEIESYDRLSMEGKVMTIYNVMPEDEGVYWCRDGDGQGGLVIVEVVDNESYTVVKPTTSRGPHPVAAEAYEGVILFTQWSEWSECSVCDKVGRRHRYGICYVNLDQNLIADYLLDSEKTAARIKLMELDDKLIDLFQAFPGGIPCRSQYLPQTMKALDFIQERPSEIMIAMCKVPCAETSSLQNLDSLFDIYPVNYQLPKQPPPPVSKTIFANLGQRVTLRCPGTTLRDVPVQWRVGGVGAGVGGGALVARQAWAAGRAHVAARGHLVLHAALLHDHNLYSCWQRDKVAGTVKLVVCGGWQRHAALLLAVAAAALLLRLPRPRR